MERPIAVKAEVVWLQENMMLTKADIKEELSEFQSEECDAVIKCEVEIEENSFPENRTISTLSTESLCEDDGQQHRSYTGIGNILTKGPERPQFSSTAGIKAEEVLEFDREENNAIVKSEIEIEDTSIAEDRSQFPVFIQDYEHLYAGQKQFQCEYCIKSFTRARNLAAHIKIHTREKPFKCEHCSKCFTRADNLTTHKKIHMGEKPFKCDHCCKCFSQRCNLNVHLMTHTGEKPFKCEFCSKCFTRAHSLAGHRRSHTGEKPFVCEHCRKCFTQRGNLVLHMRSHKEDKPFKCEQCSKTFTRNCKLVNHKKTHTGEKRMKCEQCKECFTTPEDFVEHRRTHVK